MKAWVLHGIDDIRLEEVEKPQPGEREVLVEVKAAGICGSDIPRIYQNGSTFPTGNEWENAHSLSLPGWVGQSTRLCHHARKLMSWNQWI